MLFSTTNLSSLKKLRDDVKIVKEGEECGIVINDFNVCVACSICFGVFIGPFCL